MVITACGGANPSPSAGQHAGLPEARTYAAMAYDPIHKNLLLLGGEDASLGLVPSVWSFDPGTQKWHHVGNLPPGVEPTEGAAFDVAAGKVIVHVSWTYHTTKEFVSETWAFDPVTGAWENRKPVESPPPGICGCVAQMAYDEESKKVVLFGGLDVHPWTETNDTWAYDYASNRWTKMPRPADESRLPAPRNDNGLTYDRRADRIILFGGDNEYGPAPGTWAYDYNTNTWTNLKPAVSPHLRSYGYLAYDQTADKTVLFGGVDSEEKPFADTWTYDFKANTWELRAPSTSPSARGWQAMAYSVESNAVVVFGGGADRGHPTNETWLYRTGTDQWSQVT